MTRAAENCSARDMKGLYAMYICCLLNICPVGKKFQLRFLRPNGSSAQCSCFYPTCVDYNCVFPFLRTPGNKQEKAITTKYLLKCTSCVSPVTGLILPGRMRLPRLEDPRSTEEGTRTGFQTFASFFFSEFEKPIKNSA